MLLGSALFSSWFLRIWELLVSTIVVEHRRSWNKGSDKMGMRKLYALTQNFLTDGANVFVWDFDSDCGKIF